MMLAEELYIEDNATTFDRYLPKAEMAGNIVTLLSPSLKELERVVDLTKDRSAGIISTNFRIYEPNAPISVTGTGKEISEPDHDFIVPFKPKNSFKVKAKIRSVSKFVPKPFFD